MEIIEKRHLTSAQSCNLYQNLYLWFHDSLRIYHKIHQDAFELPVDSSVKSRPFCRPYIPPKNKQLEKTLIFAHLQETNLF